MIDVRTAFCGVRIPVEDFFDACISEYGALAINSMLVTVRGLIFCLPEGEMHLQEPADAPAVYRAIYNGRGSI